MPSKRSALTFFMASAAALLAGFGIAQASTAQNDGTVPASAQNPIVVELFQSQGCSSCPPANAYVNSIADRPDILALSFAVTYWDRLGWKDIFGSPRFTERQQDYAAAGQGQVATPEMIVNGSHAVVGSDKRAFDMTIAKAGPPRGGPAIMFDGTSLRLGTAMAGKASTVWLVRYDPRLRNVPIRAGENSGRTLPHRGIVRELVKIGDWTGASASYSLPRANERGLSSAILVQRGAGGPIIAARKL